MLIEGSFPASASAQDLLRHLFDAQLMASCLPGCESLEQLEPDLYRTVLLISLAGISARFVLRLAVNRRLGNCIWIETRGEEGGNASYLQADSEVSVSETAQGSLVQYRSEVSVTGRLGRFALGMMKKKAQSMGREFAANLQERLQAMESASAAPGGH